jgi:hypothetical protein
MSDTLLLAGIAVLIAVAVGGGLKLFGVDIPVINSWPRRILLFVIAFALIGGGYLTRESEESSVEIAGIGFSREVTSANLGLPDIALQLRNSGKKIAFVTRVELEVKRVWQIQPTDFVAFGGFQAPNRIYDGNVSLTLVPSVSALSVSQAVDPNSVDRFDLSLSVSGDDPNRDQIILMSVTVVYDAREARAKSGDFLVVNLHLANRYLSHTDPTDDRTAIAASDRRILEAVGQVEAQRSGDLDEIVRSLFP